MYMQTFNKITPTVERQLNKQLLELEKWLNNWWLKIAPEKYFYSIFSNNKKGHKKEKLDLTLYNSQINWDNNVTFLGLRFDKHLTFKYQISHLKKAAMKD